MVKIVHMADTHLGYRARRGTINKWAIENYSKPYEQDIYDTFLKVMMDISKMKDLDFVVHCGDMFHQPSLYNTYPPPEPARRTLKQGLDLFFKNTQDQVPFIYVEGNHGIFRGYEFTPFESHFTKEAYPNLHYFKEADLLQAMKTYKSLKLEFPDKNICFYLFPYFEFRTVEAYKDRYDNWIEKQQPLKGKEQINIAVAHGSDLDGTLHDKINSEDYGYDYVALGHEHKLREVSKTHYYSGSLLPLNFKEVYENQGYLIVEIANTTKVLTVKKIFTQGFLKRIFKTIQININPKQSLEDIEKLLDLELNRFITQEGFVSKTAARLKFEFTGEMTFERNWQINELMARKRRDCFSQPDKYNIMQFIWKVSDISESLEDDLSSGIIQDYILERPDDEFKVFVKEKLSEDNTNYNINKLTQFGMKAIKKALNIMEKEKEV